MKTLTLINTPIGCGFGKRIGATAIAQLVNSTNIIVICPAPLRYIWHHETKLKTESIITYERALRYCDDLETMINEQTALIFDELKARGSGKKTRPALERLMRKAGTVVVLDHDCPQPNNFFQNTVVPAWVRTK